MYIVRLLVFSSFLIGLKSFAKQYPLENLYRQSQINFHRKNYQKALPQLRNYLSESKSKAYKKDRLLWVIDQVGFIYLRVQKDSDAAIKFFEKISNDPRLDEAQQDDVTEWLAASKEWHKNIGKMADHTPNKLFTKGQFYFKEGRKRSKYISDNSGNAYFHIAATYLSPFIIKNDEDPRIIEALLMMGTIRTHIHHDSDYMSENFYLKEVIRRKPHSHPAWKAYQCLEEQIRFGYSGSGGENTPPSVKSMLENFKKLAKPKKVAVKTVSPAPLK